MCMCVGDEAGGMEKKVCVRCFGATWPREIEHLSCAQDSFHISISITVLVWHGLFSLAIKSKFFFLYFLFTLHTRLVLFCFLLFLCRRLSNSFAISDRIEFDHLPRIVDGVISYEYRVNIVCTIWRGSSIIFSLLIGIRFVNLVRETRMRTSLGNLVESARRRDLLSMRHERSARASK